MKIAPGSIFGDETEVIVKAFKNMMRATTVRKKRDGWPVIHNNGIKNGKTMALTGKDCDDMGREIVCLLWEGRGEGEGNSVGREDMLG